MGTSLRRWRRSVSSGVGEIMDIWYSRSNNSYEVCVMYWSGECIEPGKPVSFCLYAQVLRSIKFVMAWVEALLTL